ncbi:MAG: hypothetical protein CW335_06150 [Clostridiales bacterium]|nr:hypothetical protein [Clostridiales bacterium]
MYQIKRFSTTQKVASEADLGRINEFSRRELTAEDIYTFSIRACDNLPDRDYERFTEDCLKELAVLFVGKTVLFDHCWSATMQTARVYASEVVTEGKEAYLRLDAYMLKNDQNASIIEAIDGGILKEVSVGCAIKTARCSICGELYGSCEHRKGQPYDDEMCIVELSEPTDAYEVSFVAVPAQPKAGVQKSADGTETMSINDVDRAKAQIAIEKLRYGG